MSSKRLLRVCPQCGRLHYSTNYLCPKHSRQLRNFGKFLDNNPRTVYDSNEIRITKDFAEVDTYNKDGVKQITFLVDTEDVPLVSKYKWRAKWYKKDKTWYVAGIDTVTKKHIYLHHLLLGFPVGTIDHINGNTLDNRKCNLRVVDKSIQSLNRIIKNTTGVRGVSKDKKGYVARFTFQHKEYRSKRFNSIEEASYFRYLLVQAFCPISLRDTDMQWSSKLTAAQREDINTYFLNRFKDRV